MPPISSRRDSPYYPSRIVQCSLIYLNQRDSRLERREELKAHIFLMMPDRVPHARSPLLTKNALREVRYVPQAFAENTSMLIGGSTVLHISLCEKESYAILVHSAAISYLLREFFKVVWDRVALPKK